MRLLRDGGITLILAITAAVAPGRPLGAQTERQDPHLRADCRLAAQVLETGHPAPHYTWALELIARCEQTGAPVLAGLWRRHAAATEHLNSLFLSSYTLRDARITDAAIGAARDPGTPRLVRLNAIRVLAGHAVPEFLLSIPDLLLVESDSARYPFPTVDHVPVRSGDHPVDQATIRGIVAALASIASDADPDVATAATRTRRQLCLRLRWQDCSRRS